MGQIYCKKCKVEVVASGCDSARGHLINGIIKKDDKNEKNFY